MVLRSARHLALVLLAVAVASNARATLPNEADQPIRQFLTQPDTLRPYVAVRRLEAQSGSRHGWVEALTEYSLDRGFDYRITAEGGSPYVRSKVLKAVLDGEREAVRQGELARGSLTLANYSFEPNGVDGEGLANVLLVPRRQERVLVAGTMFLNSSDGALVRVQGRLAKSPSFWLKNVDVVRRYQRIDGIVVPIALETRAQVRFVGDATLRMTYEYSEIDGRTVTSGH